MSGSAVSERFRAHARLKVLMTVVLLVAFSVPYFALQRFPLLAPRVLPLSALDVLVPFRPEWTLVYQSLYLLMPATAWLADSATSLMRYARGFLALSAAGFLVFLLFPVVGPRPAHDAQGLYALVVRYDTPLNSFPSLHVALAVYSWLFARRLAAGASLAAQAQPIRRWGPRVQPIRRWGPRVLVALAAAWTVAIAYSTLATKQHYAVDLAPAVLLALAAHRWAFGRTEAPQLSMKGASA
jgi:membrane-associated phospholipid phosphatase